MTTLAEYASSRELMANLTLRELRSKYKRSVLGWAWSLLNPLATMLIFTLVFRLFLRIPPPVGERSGLESFALFLLCGLLPWTFLTSSINGSIATLIGNANLIKKTYFPREILVAAQGASSLVTLLIELALLSVVLVFFGNVVLLYLPVLLLLVVVLTVFATGLSLLFSVVNVYFRDVQHLVGIVFQVWFYLTPIVYPIRLVRENIGPRARFVYELNPMVGFAEAFRDCLYDLRFPSAGRLGYLLVVSVVALAVGLTVFNRLEGRLAEEL